MGLKFVKMQACGNDFIVLDDMAENLGLSEGELRRLAVRMCDRHFGVGADGLLYLTHSRVADFRMRLFNPDGSEGEMCGNGIRCAVKYFVDNVSKLQKVRVETLAGVKDVALHTRGEEVYYSVDMGVPKLRAREIPTLSSDPDSSVLDFPMEIPNVGVVRVSAVNTGVPHAVIFVDGVDLIDVAGLGRYVRNHKMFPMGVNVDFTELVSPERVRVRVYERGVENETLCCGTGAAAVAAVAVLLGKARGNSALELAFRGGTLLVEVLTVDGGIKGVVLTGTAHRVFDGIYE